MNRKRMKELGNRLEREFEGAVARTKPLSDEERKWYKAAVEDSRPKKQTSIRIRQWQIEFAREVARKHGLRGYQTVIDKILTRAMLNPEFMGSI